MSLGSIMLDLAGTALDAEDRELLVHPAVGGVILFSRNAESPAQIAELTASIHGLREPRLLVGVDQEGGRVQRFREGFTRLPPAGRFGQLHARDPARARAACASVAWLMAAELRAVGVDFSFAPVLDLDRSISQVIGDRGFASQAMPVCDLAAAWMGGARRAGMASVGKHFPGHGGVAADSHAELPTDSRGLAEIEREDLVPFQRLIDHGLEAVMPAHVVYPCIDRRPAGFSSIWLRDVLRGRLGFQGVIFSDDLNMAAAGAGGNYVERAQSAEQAGCDMLLICNNRPAAAAIVEAFGDRRDPVVVLRQVRMRGRGQFDRARLREQPEWARAIRSVAQLEELETRDLGLADPTETGRAG
ncbi:beta-N-acetylhexosaminidase [Thiocystis violascens]|uniref:Beta-hexosaminidase n=1 Tax=Thiocystis violascens (strain ATCC 17096 / DSM 198 / 6111) TaxID=765911 RepID=I3YDH0_THIV6|nr:beta-N-acetylhexosaminidase [Thiocystis violascens]AFL75038.1 beta-glucosidase-like glycosyl hydrolase [Thiocystis violascens DSM 198]